ncbi:MAG: ABC transporter ATP-binding protein [Ignavibacteria bacterium]|jgi:heme exporter protein A
MAETPINPLPLSLEINKLKKNFDRRTIFKDLNFSLSNRDSLAITGRNGSGKSTLIKILANVLVQTSGSVDFKIDNKPIERSEYYKYIGLVSPYLNLYDEFTGYENLHFVSRVRGIPAELISNELERVGLYDRRNDPVKIYSSGMKQRLKVAFAIMHQPRILLLDEPTSNLDAQGVEIIDRLCEEYKNQNILIIATNDEHERSLCEKEINLNPPNGKENH